MAPAIDPHGLKRRLTCILATDAVGYSRLVSENEGNALRILAAHRAVIDGIIAFHDGRIISTAGDSVLAEFRSVVDAVRCAVEIQDALKTRNESLTEPQRMLFRIGINLGEVVVKGDDLLGDGVNVAARLEGLAEPGGILISSSVYDQITGKLDLGFDDIGEQTFKNISRPIRAFRVSGAGGTIRAHPASRSASTTAARRALPIAIGAIVIAAGAGGIAWMQGSIGGARTAEERVATVDPAQTKFETALAASEKARADAEQRARTADADAIKARAEGEATALRARAENSAAAILSKAQSEAAVIRSQATQEASRAKSDDALAIKARAEADTVALRTKAESEAAALRVKAESDAAEVKARAQADAAQLAQAGTKVVQKKDERNYTKVLTDTNGMPILRLTVAYIGKGPRGTLNSIHPCITENRNTDFYYVTWENLTEHDIEFVAGERTNDQGIRLNTTSNDKGKQEVVAARHRIDMKTEFSGDRLLRAKERREWRNMFFCDRAFDYNVLRQLYTVKHLEREYKIEFYRVFER